MKCQKSPIFLQYFCTPLTLCCEKITPRTAPRTTCTPLQIFVQCTQYRGSKAEKMSNNKGPCSAETSENCRGKFPNTEHKCRIDGCNAFICSLCNPLEKGFHCEDNFNFGNSYMCYTCYIKGTGSTEGRPHEWKYDEMRWNSLLGQLLFL